MAGIVEADELCRMVELGAEAGPPAFQAGVKAERQAEADAKRERAEKERNSREDEAKSAEWFKSLPEEGRMALERAFLGQANGTDARQYSPIPLNFRGHLAASEEKAERHRIKLLLPWKSFVSNPPFFV